MDLFYKNSSFPTGARQLEELMKEMKLLKEELEKMNKAIEKKE